MFYISGWIWLMIIEDGWRILKIFEHLELNGSKSHSDLCLPILSLREQYIEIVSLNLYGLSRPYGSLYGG